MIAIQRAMTEKSLAERYKELAAKPAVTNPGSACSASIESHGLPSRVYPTYDNVIAFFKDATRKINHMDKKDIACIRKEITLMGKNATDPAAKKAIRTSRVAINRSMDNQLKRLDGSKRGTTLKMGAPRKFDELR
jgi:hypothetical protein